MARPANPLAPELVMQWHPCKNGDLTPADVTAGSNRKVWWVCKLGHEWQATVANRSRGAGCPTCAGRLAEPLSVTNPGVAAQWHPTKNGDLASDQVTAGSNRQVWWVCEHGHEWQAVIANRTRGTGCPECALRPRRETVAVLPDLMAQWHPTRNGVADPDQVTAGSGRKVWWVCEHGHEWQAMVFCRTRGTGCPECAGRLTDPLSVSHPGLVAQWHSTRNGNLTPDRVTAGSSRKVWWVCEQSHEWQARVDNRSRGAGCPMCWKLRRRTVQA